MRHLITLALAGFGLVFATACTSDSEDASDDGYSPNPELCRSFCQASIEGGCDMGTLQDCQADCESTRKKFQQCLPETDALFSCGGLVCEPGAEGPDCSAETRALQVCGACIAQGSNSPCTICEKQRCCSELQAFGTAPDFDAFMTCIGTCSTTDCLDACEQQSPEAAKAFHAVDDCRNAKCPSACGGLPSTEDPVGQYCSRYEKAGCAIPDCEATLGSYGPSGCGVENYEFLECVGSKPVDCEAGDVNDPCAADLMACMEP